MGIRNKRELQKIEFIVANSWKVQFTVQK